MPDNDRAHDITVKILFTGQSSSHLDIIHSLNRSCCDETDVTNSGNLKSSFQGVLFFMYMKLSKIMMDNWHSDALH